MTSDGNSIWQLAHGRSISLGRKGILMGIVNVTPDSFSDGGRHNGLEQAVAHALRLVDEGAAIIDIGGESTRPGAADVSAAEEQDRVLPLVEALAGHPDVLISVDTYRASTARLSIAAGAHIINDVWGAQKEPEIATIAAQTGAGLCLMHTGRDRERLDDPIADQIHFLKRSLEITDSAGVSRQAIVLDPGFGFAKETVGINIELMDRFRELDVLGLPILAGTSRKRFLGTLTGRDAADRDAATAATTVILRMAGAVIFRVHNVAINRDALAVTDAMLDLHNPERI